MITRFVALVTIAMSSPGTAVDAASVDPVESVPTAAAPEALRPVPGRYAFSGGDAERQALHDRIEAVVAEMAPVLRGVARRRLVQGNPIPDALTIEVTGDAVTIAFDERRYTAILGAPAVAVVGVDGKRAELTHRIEGSRLTQRFDAPRGERWNLFRVRGDRLRLTVIIESESLPADLVYELTFTRHL
jgi:hypothetical protein